MDKDDLTKIENKLKETYDKNNRFLMTHDIEELINIQKRRVDLLADLYRDLFDSLELDDSLVYNLNQKDSEFDRTTMLADLESVVKKFAMNDSKFLTLMEDHEEAFKEIYGKEYGEDIFKTKQQLKRKSKWKKTSINK